MTDERTNLEIIDDRTNYLLEMIQKLEERIIALEREKSVVRILSSDNYYWEHG